MRKKNRRGYAYQVIDRFLYNKNKMILLSHMEASIRTTNVLENNNMKMIGDILGTSERDILKLKNCHKVTLKELNLLLEEYYGVVAVRPPTKKNRCLFCGSRCREKYCSRDHYFKHKRTKPRPIDKRVPLILSMRKQGKTLKEIGDRFNVTRERIRQILKSRMSM